MKLLFFSILSALCSHCFTQNIQDKNISVESIGINKGLSQGMVNCMWQDHFGFMWFGTLDGLNRYDGYKFQVFRNNLFDSSTISGNFITSIFEDSKGRLWIGTALTGLNLFIPEKEQFIHFTTKSKPSLSNNTVYSIQEDKYGAIWIGTEYGLNKLIVHDNIENKPSGSYTAHVSSVSSGISIKYVPLTDSNGKELFTSNPHEPAFTITKSGTIWICILRSVFSLLPVKSGKEKIVKANLPLGNGSGKMSNDAEVIYKITEDTTREILYFKGKDFFTVKDQKTGNTSFWNCQPLDISSGRNQVICDNGMFFERTSQGLICFDLLQKKMFRLRSYNSENDKILKTPFSIYKDRSGIIWIGTGGFGLLKYNPHTEYFHKVITNTITWMSAAPAGDVLMLTPELHHYVKDTAGLYPSYVLDTQFHKNILQLAGQMPDIALRDKEGIYWFNINGLVKISSHTKTVEQVNKANETIFPYFLDNKDRLWYATRQSFCLFDKKTITTTTYPFPITPAGASLYKFCEVIYQDAKGLFWLGTTEGLFSFNEATQEWRHFKNNPLDKTSLSNDIIFSICDDPHSPGKYIWIGTNGGGLNRLCTGTGKFEHIGLNEGLPSMVVYGILSDVYRQLWMSTNRGIACLKPQYDDNNTGEKGKILKKTFTCYYEENGLQSDEFNRYAYCKTRDGTLFFGGINGFNYFDPGQVKGNISIPSVLITELKINNKPVSLNSEINENNNNDKIELEEPMFLTDSITLNYADNMLSFDFAALDFTASEKNIYQYKMDGLDKDWIQSGAIHSATYTNLDPGTYTFSVKGSNSDGVWNDIGSSVILTILAPWYMTWWFRTALITALITTLYFLFHYRLRQKLKVLEIRNHIANDLHDEIGSTLSSIYIYSEVALQLSEDINPQTTKTNNYLKQISAETGDMIDALGDIVWTVNARNDRFENIINRMRASAIELFEAKGYNVHLQCTDQLNTLKLGMACRKNFYLFYKEAINNAAKYAHGKNIWITLSYSKPIILLRVKDDGGGFAYDSKQSGNGLANMQKRAMALKGSFNINSSPENGTEVQLLFPV